MNPNLIFARWSPAEDRGPRLFQGSSRAKDPVPGVRYFAYAGAGLGSKLLFPTHAYIKIREGDNDGMVSVTSATWPNALAELPWDADHFAEIGYDVNRPDLTTSFPYQAAIARVVQRATS